MQVKCLLKIYCQEQGQRYIESRAQIRSKAKTQRGRVREKGREGGRDMRKWRVGQMETDIFWQLTRRQKLLLQNPLEHFEIGLNIRYNFRMFSDYSQGIQVSRNYL